VPPGLVVVVVFLVEQAKGLLDRAIVQRPELLVIHVKRVVLGELHLDQTDGAIIYDSDKLVGDGIPDFLGTFLLYASDTLRLDHDLVGDRRQPKDTPRGAIVFGFQGKQFPAAVDYVPVLNAGLFVHGGAKSNTISEKVSNALCHAKYRNSRSRHIERPWAARQSFDAQGYGHTECHTGQFL